MLIYAIIFISVTTTFVYTLIIIMLEEDWTPYRILKELNKRKISLSLIMQEIGPAISQQWYWEKLETSIAKALGVSRKEIWPSRYDNNKHYT